MGASLREARPVGALILFGLFGPVLATLATGPAPGPLQGQAALGWPHERSARAISTGGWQAGKMRPARWPWQERSPHRRR